MLAQLCQHFFYPFVKEIINLAKRCFFTCNHLPMKIFPYCIILFLSFMQYGFAQEVENQTIDPRLVQFSGITITADSLNPVPYTKIVDVNKHRVRPATSTATFPL